MKRLAFYFAVVFAVALSCGAQDTSSSAQTSDKAPKGGHAVVKGPQKSAGAVEGDQDVRAVTGCVSKDGDNYIITNGHFKNGFAVHGSDDLAPHVGHTVRLSGTWATPGKDFNETKLKMVSDNCNPKAGAAGKHNDKNATTATPPQP
jgi:hypothetical protein